MPLAATVVLVLTGGSMVISDSAQAQVPPGGMSAAALNTLFNMYGDQGGHWTSGDGTASVVLPDGRVAWLFADTMLGTVNPDHSRPPNQPMVSNVIVIQDGTALAATLHGGTPQAPEALVKPTQIGEVFWIADGVVEGNTLKVIYNRIRTTGTGALDFEQTGVALVTFALPALTLTSVLDLPLGPAISWGSGIFPDGAWTYIYGISSAPGRMKFAHLARVPTGQISGPWQFWTGSGWSGEVNEVGRLLSGVGAGGVQKFGSQYVWVSHENNLVFDPQFVAYTSPSPTGPFNGPIQLFTAPEPQAEGLIVYDARVHPELARSGKLLVSYNVNSLTPGGTTTDVRHGRPRFVEVDWPRPATPPGVPAAPGAPTLTAHDDVAQLSWPAVNGATSYRIYQRDVTGGQTHFARLPSPATGTSATAGFLIPRHTYEYKITAVNAVGESVYSPMRTVIPHNTTPVTEAVGGTDLPTAVADQYIVELNDTTPTYAIADHARQLTAQFGGQLRWIYTLTLRGFSAELTLAQAHDLAGHPDVQSVLQNQIGTTLGTQENPPSWGLDRIDQRDTHLDQRYEFSNLGEVDVYVLDSGVMINHSTFGGRAEHGFNAYASQGIPPDDCGVGHGTHVAGTIGGTEYGVAKGVHIVSVKVTHCTGPNGEPKGVLDDVVEGLEWVIANADGPSVVNMSFGFFRLPAFQSDLDKAVRKAVKARLTVVAAAGNDNDDASTMSPARMDEVITVGATTRSDARWVVNANQGSNYGSSVDLFAPGADITSANLALAPPSRLESGTSMAAAHVSGAVALIRAAHPDYKPAEVERVLLNATTKVVAADEGPGSPYRLLLFVEAAPTHAPTSLTATANPDGTIGLNWNPVPEQGAHYLVWSRDITAGEPDLQRWGDPIFDGTTAMFSRAQHGHTYEFQVAAANGAGIGPRSAPVQATANRQPPPPPTALTATAQADGTIRLFWTATTPGLWHYVYQRDLDAEGGQGPFVRLSLPVTDGTTFTAGFLQHGHEYEHYVTAVDVDGRESAPSNTAGATATFSLPPGPTNLVATAGDRRVTLTWNSAGSGVWYGVEMRNVTANEHDFTRLALPVTTCCTFASVDLTNRTTYEYRIVALGGPGAPDSAPSNVVGATPVGLPPAPPTNLVATPGNAQASLTWTPSATPDAWYWIETRPASGNWQRLVLPVSTCCTFTSTGLTNGTTYEYRVVTIGAGGAPDSAPSNVASAQPTAPPPGAVSNLHATAGNARVDLTWTASSTPGAWYWMETRNVSAGQAWLRLPLPVTTCCSFASTGLTNDDTYEYRVVTIGGGGAPDSAPSNVASARPTAPRPGPPSNLHATAGNARVDLTWTASSTPGAWYWMETRNVSAGQAWLRLPLPVTTCCSFASTGLTNGDTYEYRVIAIGGGGAPDSTYSNVVSARPVAPQPGPPTDLTATPGDSKVMLRWTASSTPGAWYWIYSRKTGQPTWIRIPAPVTTCCTHVATYLTNGTTYEFKVTAIGSGGAPDSAPSNVVSARPMPPFPQPPSNLTAVGGDNEAWLDWAASPTPGAWYNVYMRTRYASGSGGTWIKLPLPAPTSFMTAGFLTYGYTYDFRVTAVNAAGESTPTNTVSVLIVPSGQARRCNSITSSWLLDQGYGFGPIQRYDITGSVCATRSNFNFVIDEAWNSHGHQLLVGIFWFRMFDCSTGQVAWYDTMEYPNGSTNTSHSAREYTSILVPGRLYRIEVTGVGSVDHIGLESRFHMSPPSGIIPFRASTGCF